MKRITFSVGEELAAEIKEEAWQRRLSTSSWIRAMLQQAVKQAQQRRESESK